MHSLDPPNEENFSLKHISTAIVFTGSSDRIDAAINLLEKGHIKQIFISGVGHSVRSKDLAYFHKINKPNQHVIHLGHKASNTIENVFETKDWLKKNNVSTFYLITSYYHIPRCLTLIKSNLPETAVLSHPIYPSHKPETLGQWFCKVRIIFFEYLKYLYTLFQFLHKEYLS